MKNDVNRMVVIVGGSLLLLLMLLVLLTVLGARGVLPPGFTALLISMGAAGKVATVLIALLVILGCLWALYQEVRPGVRQHKEVRLYQDEQGQVNVQATGINRLIQYVAREQPDLLEVHPDVTMTPQGLNVHCRIAVKSNVQVEPVKRVLTTRLRQALQQHLDVAIADIGILTDIRPTPEDQAGTGMDVRQPRRQLQ